MMPVPPTCVSVMELSGLLHETPRRLSPPLFAFAKGYGLTRGQGELRRNSALIPHTLLRELHKELAGSISF
jgi:hypothetical protein